MDLKRLEQRHKFCKAAVFHYYEVTECTIAQLLNCPPVGSTCQDFNEGVGDLFN